MDYLNLVKTNPVLQTIWDESDTFVKDICTKSGRDSSHGYEHMKTVAHNAVKIVFYEEIEDKESLLKKIIACAWLHDVCDYKYSEETGLYRDLDLVGTVKLAKERDIPPSNKTRMIIFLLKHFSVDEIETVCRILDRISFSTEVKKTKEDPTWCNDMDPKVRFVLDVVRDADRLEAIGRIGLERCVAYSKHAYLEKNGKEISKEELVAGVKKHADEKLLRIASDYIRTKTGKMLAAPLHTEFVQALEEFTK